MYEDFVLSILHFTVMKFQQIKDKGNSTKLLRENVLGYLDLEFYISETWFNYKGQGYFMKLVMFLVLKLKIRIFSTKMLFHWLKIQRWLKIRIFSIFKPPALRRRSGGYGL